VSSLRALYFDGRSSAGHEVTVSLDNRNLVHLRGEGIDLAWPLAGLRVSERIGASPRRIHFPDGAQCETVDNDAVDALFAAQAPAGTHLLHRWESGLRYVLAAVVITVAAASGFVVWGIPALARQVAFALPDATEAVIARDALAALDSFVLGPSTLPVGRQQALRRLCEGMTADSGNAAPLRLELRQGKRAGANAFALPAGIIVMTDELVALAKDDRELEAVLAHEIGHQRQRHILRQMLQDSATALVIAAVIGDIASLTSLAAAAPTLLLRAKFSRDFEREADDYALAYLAKRGIPGETFAAILQRMEEKRPGSGDGADYLSSHPATRERVMRARKN